MKTILTWLKNVGLFLLKNWRFSLPALILFLFVIIPNKTFGEIFGFISGIIFMGFLWYAYTHFLKNKTNG
jgi:uncharacterized membrane protein required for colicin V production